MNTIKIGNDNKSQVEMSIRFDSFFSIDFIHFLSPDLLLLLYSSVSVYVYIFFLLLYIVLILPFVFTFYFMYFVYHIPFTVLHLYSIIHLNCHSLIHANLFHSVSVSALCGYGKITLPRSFCGRHRNEYYRVMYMCY